MEQLLTDLESIQLQDALESAFRSQSALEQMVHLQLKETLGAIATGGSYSEVLQSLIFWAQTNQRIEALIRGARVVLQRLFVPGLLNLLPERELLDWPFRA